VRSFGLNDTAERYNHLRKFYWCFCRFCEL